MILERASETGPGQPPLLSHILSPDQALVSWLLGRYQPQADLRPHTSLSLPQADDANRLLWRGVLPDVLPLAELADRVEKALSRAPLTIAGGDKQVRRIAWCTGAAQNYIEQAAQLGVDAFLSGEVSEPTRVERWRLARDVVNRLSDAMGRPRVTPSGVESELHSMTRELSPSSRGASSPSRSAMSATARYIAPVSR